MHLVGIFLEWFQNKIRYVKMVCSRTVSEQTLLYGTALEKFLMFALEQF